jgi:hypothetical protein
MTVIDFVRSPLGRVTRVALGFALIAYGSILASLVGLVLMMVGMVPAVTGLVDMCLDRYAVPHADSVLVATPHSGPSRAERAKQVQSTSQGRGTAVNGIPRASPWLVGEGGSHV